VPSSFRTELITRFTDDGRFVVHEPFEFASERAEALISVPVGTVTDFASIPLGLRNILSPTGRYGKAAVVHDLLYQTGRAGSREITRREADDVLDEGMQVLEVGRFTRWVIMAGIRLGGWVAWNKYRRAEGL